MRSAQRRERSARTMPWRQLNRRQTRKSSRTCQVLILLKKPSDQKETLQKTISDVSLDDSNRVQTKLARKHS
jgi:hypothetical protein